MKFAVFASLLAGAAAFAPSQHASKTPLRMSEEAVEDEAAAPVAAAPVAAAVSSKPYKGEIGAQAPLGYFDPLGVMEGKSQAEFDRLRYVELKHGRVAMLAVVGYLVTASGARWGFDIDFAGVKYADMPMGYDALYSQPLLGKLQMFLTVFILEVAVMKDVTGTGEFLGDFRNGIDLGWDKQSDEWKANKRAIELNNGRAAQMGIFGLMLHENLGNINELLPLP